MFKKIVNIVFFVLVSILIIPALAGLIWERPFLAVSIRSGSMEPLLSRGDMVLIRPDFGNTGYALGQIVVFRSKENGIDQWTMHRIVDGNARDGFITRGDNNENTDQDEFGYPAIKPDWIAGVVAEIGSKPLKIPLLGHIPLYLESKMSSPVLVVFFSFLLIVILLLVEIFKPRGRRKKERISKGQICFIGGLAFWFFMGVAMLMSSLFITLPFGVEESAGALMGSSIGVLKHGTSHSFNIAQIKNNSFFPSYYYVVSNDEQLVPLKSALILERGQSAQLEVVLSAQSLGIHHARVIVAMFLPFLPPALIHYLVNTNYWLALATVSLVSALPMFVIPFLDLKYRRHLAKAWRKKCYFWSR